MARGTLTFHQLYNSSQPKPLHPQQLRVRQMIRDARKAGRELERIWVHVDGRVELGFTDANEQAAKVEDDGNPWDKALGHEAR